MSDRVEGTMVLDGLIEGDPPSLPDIRDRLEEWVARAQGLGLPFSVEFDGGRFSILADNRPILISSLQGRHEPSDAVAAALGTLLELFPPPERHRIFCTLRSIEYRRNLEVQSVYGIAADGTVNSRQHIVETDTTAPQKPMTRKAQAKLVGLGVLVALALFGLSALFVDYGDLWKDLTQSTRLMNPNHITVETGPFAEFFTVEERRFRNNPRGLVLSLRRTDAFPTDDAEAGERIASAGDDTMARLAAEAIARGYLRGELFAADGDYLGTALLRIRELRERKQADCDLPYSSRRKPARIVLLP